MYQDEEIYSKLYFRLFNTYEDVINLLEKSKVTQDDVTDEVISILKSAQLACEEAYLQYTDDEMAVKNEINLMYDPKFLKLTQQMYEEYCKEHPFTEEDDENC